MKGNTPQNNPVGWHDRGYLPHFDGGRIAQFITFRLHDALPQRLLNRWRIEIEDNRDESDSELRDRIDEWLDRGAGACHLRNRSIARLVQGALLRFDGERYGFSAWVIMPNHVHLLLTPHEHSLSDIVHSIKSYSAQEANKLLQRRGSFWFEDYFDRYIRDLDHFEKVINYIEDNPVKAGLCNIASDWEFSSAGFRSKKKTA